MIVDLCGIPLHLVDNVDLVGATEEHLLTIDDQKEGER